MLTPIVAYYLLLDWAGMVERSKRLIPPRWLPSVQSFLDETDEVLGQYLRGQLLVMGVLAVFYTVALALVGLKLALPIGVFTGLAVFVPYLGFGLGLVMGLLAVYYSVALGLFGLDLALPIGVFTGLAVFVPYLGFGVGLTLATLAGLLEFSAQSGMGYTVAMVGVVYGLGQLLESFFLTPRLVGERIGLHPLAVIFALLAFGQLLGFVGVLIALPVSAVLLVAIRRVKQGYLASGLYQG